MKKAAIIVIIFVVFAGLAQADTTTVCWDGSGDYTSIQDGIDAATNGDEVVVCDGTYTGEGNRDIDFKGKAITVKSENGPESCTIDCESACWEGWWEGWWEGAWGDSHRGFYFHQAEDANSILQGFTIINGCIPGDPLVWEEPWNPEPNHKIGGGIYCELASPTIINCVIRDCATEWGGGIGCVGASPVIIDCTIADCHAGGLGWWESGGFGGGVALLDGSNATITNCTITNNMGWWNSAGGGIYCRDSGPKISRCIISSNSATGNIEKGGGVCFSGYYPDMRLEHCIIAQNTADDGAGLKCYQSNPIITNCIITGNVARNRGGGIHSGTDYYGGSHTSATITNCTIVGNSADYYGGGILCGYKTDTIISNCILWDNTAPSGHEITLGSYYSGCAATLLYNNIQGGLAELYVDSGGCTLFWGPANIDANPLFANPSNGDYHLQSQAGRWGPNENDWVYDANTSRCIDAGNPGSPLGDEPNDVNNVRINMGAYGGTAEASMPPYDWALLADLTNDGEVDSNDLAAFVDYWLYNEKCVPSDLNRDQYVDMFDFALFGRDWFLETTWHE